MESNMESQMQTMTRSEVSNFFLGGGGGGEGGGGVVSVWGFL